MSSNSDEASNADPDAYVGEVSSLQASSPPRPSIGVRNDDPEAQPQAHAGANRATSASSDEDSEDSEEQRENRFQGPASTWRDHTREERGLAASLDQQRANDLSVHLYNTHALKARLRDPQLAAAAKPWQSKRGWLRVDGEGKVPWHPDPHWTAWPLPASEVPRREEVFGVSPADLDGDGSYRKVEPWRPSADLASEIQALILRKGKERFRRRRWVDGKDDVSAEVPASKAQTKASDDAGPDSLREAKPAVFLRTARYQPVFLADDDKAEEITSPSVRHILSKVDDLLAGLHTSRVGQRRVLSASKSRSRPRNAKPRSRSHSQAAAESSARGRSQPRRKPSVSDDTPELNDADSEDGEKDNTSPPEDKQVGSSRRTRHELGQRDWSDVLGIASLVGWDQAVIDRAARRCASLFGEGMAFRTMPETAADHSEDVVVEYRPDMIPVLDSDAETRSDQHEALVSGALACPYDECPRHNEGYTRPWRWREHLRRGHKLSKEQIAEIEERLDHRAAASWSSSAKDAQTSDADEENVAGNEVSAESDESDMMGGVHNDGFLLPISGTALGRGPDIKRPRRRSTDAKEMGAGKRRKMEHEEEEEEEEEGKEESELNDFK